MRIELNRIGKDWIEYIVKTKNKNISPCDISDDDSSCDHFLTGV